MRNPLRRTLAMALPALAALALAAPAALAQTAAPAALTLDGLNTILANMGYETKMDSGGKSFSIVLKGNYDLIVNFVVGANTGNVLAYVYLSLYTPDQMERLNMTQLLLASDPGPSFFTLERKEKNFQLYVQRSIPAVAATPLILRTTLENLRALTTANETYWDAKKWDPPG